MFEMDPSNPMARLFYVWVLILNERRADAAALVSEMPLDVRETVAGRLTMFLMQAVSGSVGEAESAVAPVMETMAGGGELFPRMLAEGWAVGGEPARALDWLEIAVRRGFINYLFLTRHDPFLAGVRTHPRFAEIAERVRERWERFES
jgi:non-specific serine/threonine protein kinase